ncbi:MAG TPA: mycothiol conjugate amidase Mca [Acidimicrobiales bacterium]|nr:mycothiol conjugate amidase Mca [Acidimicrobiales bacterium]
MTEPLCLLTVHAHPDDEASKGAATVARYHAEGVRTVLVCCTGGEEGDILNPAMDTEEVRADLPAIRARELQAATAAIGYDEVVLLGYRDSGMPESAANADPRSFARAPLEEAVGKLVAVIRRERPQVVVTYDEDQRGYPHPDHLRVHEISVAAFEAAGDPDAFPAAGPPWQPAKLYYVGWSSARILAMHDKFLELGLESPFGEDWLERAQANTRSFTTVVDVSGYTDVRRQALLAHATQIDPTSPFWFGLPPEVAREVHPVDEYVLARRAPSPGPVDPSGRPGTAGGDDVADAAGDPGSLRLPADVGPADAPFEDDLFAGVRERASR